MTPQVKNITLHWSMLALQFIVAGLTSWTVYTVNQLQVNDATQTANISNMKETLVDIKEGLYGDPKIRSENKEAAPRATTYVYTNTHIK